MEHRERDKDNPAKIFLRRYRQAEQCLDSTQARMQELRDKCYRTTGKVKAINLAPTGRCDFSSSLLDIISQEERLKADIAKQSQILAQVLILINRVDAKYQPLLRYRYINGYSWMIILNKFRKADGHHYALEYLFKLHGEALAQANEMLAKLG